MDYKKTLNELIEQPLPEESSLSGKIAHTHPLVWEDNELIGHGKPSAGEDHHHEIGQNADSTYFLAPAKDDDADPSHTHEVEPAPAVEEKSRASLIFSRMP